MAKPKPFQIATINAAMSAFDQHRARRFLVADEVGLGKTIVAQGVVRRLLDRHNHAPVVAFYVCSNLAIAAQNKRKLLELLPENERAIALCVVDRLTLVGTDSPPTHPKLHIYAFTPATSIPAEDGRSRTGKQAERALIYALLKLRYRQIARLFGQDAFRQKPHRDIRNDEIWRRWVQYSRRVVRSTKGLWPGFLKAIRNEFGLNERQQLPKALKIYKHDHRKLVSKLRSALAAANLSRLNPDLVVFDEFQRFRDVIIPPPDKPESRVGTLLRGETMENPPALLFLSATPYKPYARRSQGAGGDAHRSEFFDLIEFLHGGNADAKKKRQKCEAAFGVMEKELRSGRLESTTFRSAKYDVEELLRPVMSRTERFAHVDGSSTIKVDCQRAALHAQDMRVFTHLVDTFNDDPASVVYWGSVPLAAQTLGPGYVPFRTRTIVGTDGLQHLTESQRDKFVAPREWAHPKLRTLQSSFPAEKLARPWLPPSRPWWTLEGQWRPSGTGGDSKLLLFSRFRAVPQSIAALLSYSLECHYLRSRGLDYQTVVKRSALQPRSGREALLVLFYPSPWLVKSTEPLASPARTRGEITKCLARQIRASLMDAGVAVEGETKRPVWQLLVRAESTLGVWQNGRRAWRELARVQARDVDSDTAFTTLIERLDEEARLKLGSISAHEVRKLAEFALTAPGVVVGRATFRHWTEAASTEIGAVLKVCWNGLRNYLDQPIFVRTLGGGERGYPDAIREAVFKSNFEALLDEHIWLLKQVNGLQGAEIADELLSGLTIRGSNVFFHSVRALKDRFTLRCHAALPFSDRQAKDIAGQAAERPLRPDELRKAFNSPFWPYVLATTSIGQEGLDFHCWCDTLVHWDLAHDPVSHEQRQGRIQRFGALSIRRQIAKLTSIAIEHRVGFPKSPWEAVADAADQQYSDDSGLRPWWIMPGAVTRNVLLTVPLSEEISRYRWLSDQVLLYRLALGHPNQEDLLELLSRTVTVTPAQVKAASLQLSSFFRSSLSLDKTCGVR